MDDKPKELLSRISKKEKELLKREFLAPYDPSIKTSIVKVDGLSYKFRIIGFNGSGFGIFEPVDASCAKFKREADSEVARLYLSKLPRICFILVCSTDRGWCAYPMNAQSALTQIGLCSEAIIKLVSDAERFDVVSTRYDGFNFWFEELFSGADSVKSQDMRDCFSKRYKSAELMRSSFGKIKGITPEDKKAFHLAVSAWDIFKKQTTEEQLKIFLARGGSVLDLFVIRGINIEVRWQSAAGEKYQSLVRKGSFDVVSAGICLTDSWVW